MLSSRRYPRTLMALVVSVFAVFSMAGTSHAVLVEFDFNSLSNGSDGLAIAAYMTAVYGSSVLVTGAFASTLSDSLGPDTHIANTSDGIAVDIITISFPVVPITSMQFDWEVKGEIGLIAFQWRAYDAGGIPIGSDIFNFPGGGIHSGNTGLITFGTPVAKLEFTDNVQHQIGVDNLYVSQVPEPGTLPLLGAGLVALFALIPRVYRRPRPSAKR
jgi:hypothetical protein